MRFFSGIILIVTLVMVLGCASNPKNRATPEQMATLDSLLQQRSFVIKADWAKPLPTQSMGAIANAGLLPLGSTLNRIDLAGTESYLRVSGDSVMARFPYFGEQQMPGIYNPDDAGIVFNGVPTDFEMRPNAKQGGYNMSFNINNGTESFQVSALMLTSKSSTVTIGSSHRRLIQYFGKISADTKE
ncbi:DUF4251 domain-containing protein [Flagellimonas meishanensis]|uniref:DUF4251 domain-containing protein n=1 Tax=Flagellimonas meishanensis TaxID=2873264 RepID=UPI001CA68F81|nr:DUF4251 domain-containing protein [[Muricauda] meishanensis]